MKWGFVIALTPVHCPVCNNQNVVNHGYVPKPKDDGPIIDKLLELADRNPRLGFGKLFPKIKRLGNIWSHRRFYHVYCELKLNLSIRGKKRLPPLHPEPLAVPEAVNICWSIKQKKPSYIIAARRLEEAVATIPISAVT
ncbi:MAG: hypothetical protein HQL70_01280 [Magnetococcales bacterium]|nr:hypothetical protein [Magnetococcales bacterium]